MTNRAAANGRSALEEPLPGMVGRHPKMLDVYRLTRLAATAELPVLIVGETGTGKELVARALHVLSGEVSRPFRVVNCAAIPESLAEGELFGWERGAFSGAVSRRIGKLELANGGMLVLDEACSLSVALQAKLLRAIEYGEFERVGGSELIRSRFRLVTAVSEPVDALLDDGRWRTDFAARVEVLTVELPPLRVRGADIGLLARTFLAATCAERGTTKVFHDNALGVLEGYAWPRNVRQLRTLISRLVVVVEGPVIGVADVVAQLPGLDPVDERAHLAAVLVAHGGNVSRAARTLGIARSTMYERLIRARVLERQEKASDPDSYPVRVGQVQPDQRDGK